MDPTMLESRIDTKPWQSKALLGFDLETTGIDRYKDVPVSAALICFENDQVVNQDYFLIDPGRSIPQEATKIHSISTRHAQKNGIELRTAISKLYTIIIGTTAWSTPIVGMNLSYDLTMLDTLVQAHLGCCLGEELLNVLDVLVIDRHFDPYRKGPRKLVDLARHYNVHLPNAHHAAGDATGAVKVLLAQVARYPELARMGPRQATIEQKEWHRQWATGYSTHRVSQGKSALEADEFDWPIARRSPEKSPDVNNPGLGYQLGGKNTATNERAARPAAPLSQCPPSPVLTTAPPTKSDHIGIAESELSARYGWIARCYAHATYTDVWFQPMGAKRAERLVICGTVNESELDMTASWLSGQMVDRIVVTAPLKTNCSHLPRHDGLLVGICTTTEENDNLRLELEMAARPEVYAEI